VIHGIKRSRYGREALRLVWLLVPLVERRITDDSCRRSLDPFSRTDKVVSERANADATRPVIARRVHLSFLRAVKSHRLT
jgi:hypothetical protein